MRNINILMIGSSNTFYKYITKLKKYIVSRDLRYFKYKNCTFYTHDWGWDYKSLNINVIYLLPCAEVRLGDDILYLVELYHPCILKQNEKVYKSEEWLKLFK